MDTLRRTGVGVIVCVLAGLLCQSSCIAGAEQGQPAQKPGEQLLLEIMDLHAQLVTNDVFLAQAKMLGAYLESAQPMEEAKKTDIYRKILDILLKIKGSPPQVPASPAQQKAKPEEKPLGQEQEGGSVFVPGAALLEIFKLEDTETKQFESIPDLPVIRAYWKRDLACSGSGFVLPDRLSEIGEGSAYVAKFSFYYEAKQAGRYGFTVRRGHDVMCRLTAGDVEITRSAGRESVCQGMVNLEKGFHRVELWVLSKANARVYFGSDCDFQANILTPDAFDAVPLTKNMMLLKADQMKAGEGARGEKAKDQPRRPYVDY